MEQTIQELVKIENSAKKSMQEAERKKKELSESLKSSRINMETKIYTNMEKQIAKLQKDAEEESDRIIRELTKRKDIKLAGIQKDYDKNHESMENEIFIAITGQEWKKKYNKNNA